MPIQPRRPLALLVATTLVGAVLLVSAAASAQAQSLKVDWSGTRVSIAASGVPLSAVLTEVARATGSAVVGLEKATDPITIDIDHLTLHDALRTLLADKNYIYFERHEAVSPAAGAVKLWIFRPGQVITPACMAPGGACAEGSPGVVAFDGSANGASFERSPFGPSPAEAESARLNAEGAFAPNASSASLLSLAKSPDPQVRMRALQTMAVQNSRIGVEAITSALDDEHPFVRAEAIELMLSLNGPGAAADRELGNLATHRDPDVRISAALALGSESGEDSEALLKRLQSDEDPRVKSIAAQMLQQKESAKNKSGKAKQQQ